LHVEQLRIEQWFPYDETAAACAGLALARRRRHLSHHRARRSASFSSSCATLGMTGHTIPPTQEFHDPVPSLTTVTVAAVSPSRGTVAWHQRRGTIARGGQVPACLDVAGLASLVTRWTAGSQWLGLRHDGVKESSATTDKTRGRLTAGL
jgi:hypothetical protein